MYYVTYRLIMRNIGRQRGEPHFDAGDWNTLEQPFPAHTDADAFIAEMKEGDDPDTSFCRWEYATVFVSEN